MYTYYTFAALGYSSPLKHYLTQAQLAQFFLGVGVTVILYWEKDCLNPAQTISLLAIHIYTVFLIYLFGKFYVDSYLTKKKDAKLLDSFILQRKIGFKHQQLGSAQWYETSQKAV
jgi:hypothetical protein